MSSLCLLYVLALGAENLGPAPRLTEIEDSTPLTAIASRQDPAFPERAIDEMRAMNEHFLTLSRAAEAEVLAAARCENGCPARMEQAVTRLRCVDQEHGRAQSAIESSERAALAIRQAEAERSPDLALINEVELAKIELALGRVRQSATEVAVCTGQRSGSLSVAYN